MTVIGGERGSRHLKGLIPSAVKQRGQFRTAIRPRIVTAGAQVRGHALPLPGASGIRITHRLLDEGRQLGHARSRSAAAASSAKS